jgi:hypothetical protein
MDDLRRQRFEEQQADVMEIEHLVASPFLLLIRFFEGAFLLLFLGAWTLITSIYLFIGGGDVLTRAKDARALIQDPSRVLTYSLNLADLSTDRNGGDGGYGSYAPVCSTTGWNYDTQSDAGATRQAATLAIAYQNATIMSAAMRRIFTIMKEDATYATNDALYAINLCEPSPDDTIVLKHAPVVNIRYAHGVIAGVCLKGHCNYGSDAEQSNWSSWLSVTTAYRNDDLSPHITWFDSGTLSEGQQKAVDAMNQMSTDAFWLQAAHDNDIQDDPQVLRFAEMARVHRDRIMWPNGKPYTAGIK